MRPDGLDNDARNIAGGQSGAPHRPTKRRRTLQGQETGRSSAGPGTGGSHHKVSQEERIPQATVAIQPYAQAPRSPTGEGENAAMEAPARIGAAYHSRLTARRDSSRDIDLLFGDVDL